jgi:hypothetical protein
MSNKFLLTNLSFALRLYCLWAPIVWSQIFANDCKKQAFCFSISKKGNTAGCPTNISPERKEAHDNMYRYDVCNSLNSKILYLHWAAAILYILYLYHELTTIFVVRILKQNHKFCNNHSWYGSSEKLGPDKIIRLRIGITATFIKCPMASNSCRNL